MVLLRSLCRTATAASVAALRSSRSAASNHPLRNRFLVTRGFFAVSSSSPSNRTPNDLWYPRAMDIGQVRVTQLFFPNQMAILGNDKTLESPILS